MSEKAIVDANQLAAEFVATANQQNSDMIADAMIDGLNRVTMSVEEYEALQATTPEPVNGEPLTISDYMMGLSIVLASCCENIGDHMKDQVEHPQFVIFEALGGMARNILRREK